MENTFYFMKTSIISKLGTILSLFCLINLASCSMLKPNINTTSSGAKVAIASTPQGATVLVNGAVIGTTPCEITLPEFQSIVDLKTSNKKDTSLPRTSDGKVNIDKYIETISYNLTFVKDGYKTKTEKLAPTVAISENFAAKVAGIAYSPINVTLEKGDAYVKDPTIVAGEANTMVNRDAPGSTALERTIIRWYFDSEPRGARVFWRVVSSIPSIVKNTNETYLGSTPYEDTRSFNILGLSYENSRDVQIEIKVTRPGYMDQIKRFNVRQAIDQQEISSFFDMVEK